MIAMEKVSKRDVLKGIGGATGASLFANSASAEESHNNTPSPEYEKEELSNYYTGEYVEYAFSTQTFQSVYEFLLEENMYLDINSTEGYAVETRVNEHILLQIPYVYSSGYCSIRIQEDHAFVRAMVSENDETRLYVSNPNVISEMEKDVVTIEKLKEYRDRVQENSDQYTTMAQGDCSVIDFTELCPYLTVFGTVGTVALYFVNPGVGVVATIALADFLAAGCTASAIVEDWDGDNCKHGDIQVCTDYACSKIGGVVTCNPVPDIYIKPVC